MGSFAKRITSLILTFVILLAVMPRAVSAAEFEKAAARAALLVDIDTGTVLYEQSAHDLLPPASTTKIMTALLVLEAIDRGEFSLDTQVKAARNLAESMKYDASHVSPRVRKNEILTVEQYLYCILVESDCACCNILAAKTAGSMEAFVELMNERAKELGCKDTVFVNSHGYPQEGHITTAYDLYLIAQEALKNETFRKIISTSVYKIPRTNEVKRERTLYNTNWLIGMPPESEQKMKYERDFKYEYCIGGKTGTSDEAGSCLVSFAQKDGRTLCCVILGSWGVKTDDGAMRRQSFTETERLFEWGFESFGYRELVRAGETVGSVKIAGAAAEAQLAAVSDSTVFLALDAEIEKKIVVDDGIKAPVSAGDAVGMLHILADDAVVAQVALVAAEDIPETVTVIDIIVDMELEIALNAAVLTAAALMAIVSKGRAAGKR
ncbi:MAG: D-alanyl-D-alanine carboxypeptidase [Clostridia bacterium]|nr:D-alanyl-D-alanine carboxypeptidase [Clostridia bacterium]